MELTYDDYRVAILSALHVELAASELMLDEVHKSLPRKPHDNNVYSYGKIGDHNAVLACLPSGRTGTTAAAQVSSQLRNTFPRMEFALLVGIGGGAPSQQHDIRLGDIVISTPSGNNGGVIQYDFGKTVAEGKFVNASSLNKPPALLLSIVSGLRAKHIHEEPRLYAHVQAAIKKNPTFSSPGPRKGILFQPGYDHPEGRPSCDRCETSERVERPEIRSTEAAIHYGLIASANQVMRHGASRKRLQEELNVLCFEMEAAGLMDDFPCLVIRSVCDYSDTHKNKEWQPYAALVAAAYGKELLEAMPAGVPTDRPIDAMVRLTTKHYEAAREAWQIETRGMYL